MKTRSSFPPDWKIFTLAHLTDPKAPIRYGVVQIGLDTPNGVPIVPIKHINRIDTTVLHRASSAIEKKYSASRIQGGDILLSVKGTIGRVGIVPENFKGNIAREIARIRPIKDIKGSFLAFLLQAAHTQRRIATATVGTTRREFSIASARAFKIAIPPFLEQQRIAEILSTWDLAIEVVEGLIENSQVQKKALMQQLLTAKKRLPGFSGEWETTTLSQVCDISKGEQKNKDSLQIIGKFPVINGGVTPSGYTTESNSLATTITVSEGGNSCGFVNLIKTPFWCGGHCYALKNVKIDNSYLFNYLKFQQTKIMRLRVGSGLPNIQKKAIGRVSLYLPPLEEQKQIAAILSDADREIEIQQNQLTHLKSEKSALMQQLLTGKRRVKINKEAAS